MLASRCISKIGDVLFDFTNNSFLSDISPNSLKLVGLYQITENLIAVIFNLFGGVIADQFRRKKIIIITDILSGLFCIIISFVSNERWLVYAIVIVNILISLLDSFSGPTYKAFTKEIVTKNNISKLNSYMETGNTLVKITIPIIAVFLYKYIGVNGSLILDGLSFLISAFIILFISPISEISKANNSFSFSIVIKDLTSGFKYLLNHKEIFLIVILSALVNFFLAAYNLLLPYSNQMFPEFAIDIYGSFLTAEAIGGIIGALIISITKIDISLQKMMILLDVAGVSLSIGPIIYEILSNYLVVILIPLSFNLFLTMFNIQIFSYTQRNVDEKFLGRVFGIIFSVALLFMPLGTFVFSCILKPANLFNFSVIGISVVILSIIFSVILKYHHN
ncbi:MAG: MFS transporter [Staphylococcus simulans]|uniref:MFS transporter n=1 Tax=Staphylococcus TaxID=1279 RepID=UPI00210D10BD|nr:MFS transporter [Staphylococcus sp. HMSC056D08]MDK8316513.1 MFS transporter [Staphylococcus simulans]